jgi:hypothetical protein
MSEHGIEPAQPGRERLKVIHVRVSEATKTHLQAIAKARNISVSKLCRQILDEFVERGILGELPASLPWPAGREEREATPGQP